MKTLMSLKPTGPSISVKMVQAGSVDTNGSGIVANCINIGSVIAGTSEFTSLAAVFARFTITRARVVILPAYGSTVANSFRNPLALGYFND